MPLPLCFKPLKAYIIARQNAKLKRMEESSEMSVSARLFRCDSSLRLSARAGALDELQSRYTGDAETRSRKRRRRRHSKPRRPDTLTIACSNSTTQVFQVLPHTTRSLGRCWHEILYQRTNSKLNSTPRLLVAFQTHQAAK